MTLYVHHQFACVPRQWDHVATRLSNETGRARLAQKGGTLYGIWRSQIGRPRDELNAIVVFDEAASGVTVDDHTAAWLNGVSGIVDIDSRAMHPTLRPTDPSPPTRQGNYAFRWFETPTAHWDEFLDLCASAWPGFESAYDSQVIGLWHYQDTTPDMRGSLLLTRRPDLAMWERSKLPANEAEAEVRRKLSRRYDLCDATGVFTTTLLSASDAADTARWA